MRQPVQPCEATGSVPAPAQGDPIPNHDTLSDTDVPLHNPLLRQVYLKPGELLMTYEPCLVTTVLGSCVAVTMFYARLRFAGICHGMLPEPKQGFAGEDDPERFKYLSEAIPFMIARFRNLGVEPQEVEVKIFGGGNVLGFENSSQSRKLVGSVNIEIAREMVEKAAMSIKAGSVGGDSGRKILFNTQTGEVLHKYL